MFSKEIEKEAKKVLDFWFVKSTPANWFVKDESFDQVIADEFLAVWKAAKQGECFGWRNSLEGRLAEIIVLDQFSRNLFRDGAKAFAQDAMALVLAQEAVKHQDYNQLPRASRQFILMPYMHSESPLIHKQAIPLFTALNDEQTLKFELAHKAIIDKFGRYPHRNKLLGRSSTDDELAFLKTENSSF